MNKMIAKYRNSANGNFGINKSDISKISERNVDILINDGRIMDHHMEYDKIWSFFIFCSMILSK